MCESDSVTISGSPSSLTKSFESNSFTAKFPDGSILSTGFQFLEVKSIQDEVIKKGLANSRKIRSFIDEADEDWKDWGVMDKHKEFLAKPKITDDVINVENIVFEEKF